MIGTRDKRETPNINKPINRYHRSLRLMPAKKYITANPAHVINRSPAPKSETLTVHQANRAIETDMIMALCATVDFVNELTDDLETCWKNISPRIPSKLYKETSFPLLASSPNKWKNPATRKLMLR